jgi:hypothetical protein
MELAAEDVNQRQAPTRTPSSRRHGAASTDCRLNDSTAIAIW